MEFSDLQQKTTYLKQSDWDRVVGAYRMAVAAHLGQKRHSGEPYITHPLEVAGIVADLHLDADTICAALLHDVVEDTTITLAELSSAFGDQVAEIVDGLTKLEKISFSGIVERQVENYRHFFIATARDPRIVVIKLADRIHNMRTLEHAPLEKQQRVARETMQIYAPLAGRCGIQSFKSELEDLSLKYLNPEIYSYLSSQIDSKRAALQERIDSCVRIFEEQLAESGIEARVYGRIKHFSSIYNKMSERNLKLEEVYDLLALRIVTKDVNSCYTVLGIAHTLGKVVASRFHDFISMPKDNGYQSLHTTIILNEPENEYLEVQIRTEKMHDLAEKGVATHWAYKEGGKPSASILDMTRWMRDLIELGQSSEGVEYLDELKAGFLDDEIRVFTPTFDILTLPSEATPVDFAYRVHTEVGHRCIGSKVNDRIAPLDTPLQNGDIVEIITAKQPKGPNPDWLKFVRSRTARERIRSWMKQEKREENIRAGEAALLREIQRAGCEAAEVMLHAELEVLARKHNKATWQDVLAAVGFGEIAVHALAQSLIGEYNRTQYADMSSVEELLAEVKVDTVTTVKGIVIDQIDGLSYRLARCCNPIPGCAIIGYVTRGRGVTIHRKGCANLRQDERERFIPAEWSAQMLDRGRFSVPIQVQALDKPNLLQQILLQVQDARVALHSVNARSGKNGVAVIDILAEVTSMEQVEGLKKRIQRMADVFSADVAVNKRSKSEE